jgi:hypothetical protein
MLIEKAESGTPIPVEAKFIEDVWRTQTRNAIVDTKNLCYAVG